MFVCTGKVRITSPPCLLPPLICFPSSLHLNFIIKKKTKNKWATPQSHSCLLCSGSLILLFSLPKQRSVQLHVDEIPSFPRHIRSSTFFPPPFSVLEKEICEAHMESSSLVLLKQSGLRMRNKRLRTRYREHCECVFCQWKNVVYFQDIWTAGLAQWLVCYSLCIELKEIMSFECLQIIAACVLWWTKA